MYAIKSSSKVFDKFMEFQSRLENDVNKKIKILRSGNGKDRQFDVYLKRNEIPYTLEQNGLSKKINRTLIESAKCMILNADFQKDS